MDGRLPLTVGAQSVHFIGYTLHGVKGPLMVVTTKQLRLNVSKILKKVQRIGSVTVTLRGKPVAKLTALNQEKVIRAALKGTS